MATFDGLKKAISQLGDEKTKLESRLEKLKQQREDLQAAPAAKADLIAGFSNWIDNEAQEYRGRLAKRIGMFSTRSSDAPAIGSATHPFQPGLFRLDRDVVPGRESFQTGALAMLFGPALKKAISDEIDGMDLISGPPAAQRAKELEGFDTQISDLEEQLTQLRREAQQSGIVLK